MPITGTTSPPARRDSDLVFRFLVGTARTLVDCVASPYEGDDHMFENLSEAVEAAEEELNAAHRHHLRPG